MDKCPRYWKQWVLRCPPEKRKEMNKIAYVFLQNIFWVSKERYVFKEHSRIKLATIYIHTHAHLDLIVWLNSLWIRGLTLQYMYCKYALSCNFHFYELHISLSCRKRKAYHHLLPWWGSTKTIYLRDLTVSYNGISEFYFENL